MWTIVFKEKASNILIKVPWMLKSSAEISAKRMQKKGCMRGNLYTITFEEMTT